MHPRSYLMQIEVPVPGSYSVGGECLTTEVFEQEETVLGLEVLGFLDLGYRTLHDHDN